MLTTTPMVTQYVTVINCIPGICTLFTRYVFGLKRMCFLTFLNSTRRANGPKTFSRPENGRAFRFYSGVIQIVEKCNIIGGVEVRTPLIWDV